MQACDKQSCDADPCAAATALTVKVGRSCLEEVLLLVGGNGAVAGGVGHAGQHKAVAHLSIVQEALVALVNGAGLNLAGAAGAGTWVGRKGGREGEGRRAGHRVDRSRVRI